MPRWRIPFTEDKVVTRLEERIARLVGVPASGEETHLQLSMDVAQPGANISHPNFHHDKNHGLVRYLTALIYLTTPEEGGETLFPALPFLPGRPAARTPQLEAIAGEFESITTRQITENPALRRGWPSVQAGRSGEPWARRGRRLLDSRFRRPLPAEPPPVLVLRRPPAEGEAPSPGMAMS